MSLIKITEQDKIEIVGQFKIIQVRTATWIEEDCTMVGNKAYHRHVVMPGDDVTNESAEVQNVVSAVHTQDIVDAYKAHVDQLNTDLNS